MNDRCIAASTIRKRSRRSFLVSALAASACARVPVTRAGGRRNAHTIPRTVRYADGEGVSGLNVWLFPQTSVGFIGNLIMGYLMKYDAQNRPYPELAAAIPTLGNGGISRDGLTITFALRRGVRWHDGAPVTAKDVVFSTHAAHNPANNVPLASNLAAIADVSAPGDYTVAFRLKRPYAPFTDGFFSSDSLPILPAHILGSLPNINHASYNAEPVGFGPFKFVRWKRDESVEMIANDEYVLGKPKLERILYKIIPDWNTILTELETGGLDLAVLMPAAIYERASRLPGYHGVAAPGGNFSQISFNLARPPLDDLVVRQALRLATDRKTIAEKVLHGLATLQESPIGPQSAHADRAIPLIPFDLARANALLESDGWRRGPDGVRRKGTRRLAFEVVVSTGQPQRDLQMAIVQNDWMKIGVSLTIKHFLPTVLYGAAGEGGILQNGRFDLETSSEGYGLFGDIGPVFSCTALRPRGANVDDYCSTAFDAALTAFDADYDRGRSQRDADTFQRILVRDAPTIVLDIPADLSVVNDDLRGFAPRGTLDGAELWST